ncbi:MAG: ATP-binding protein [Bdellovibrionota bacterium]
MSSAEKHTLVEDKHHSLLRVMDRCFGAYFMGLALVSGIAAYQHQTSWWGFASQLAFPITNLILSQVSFRLKDPKPFEIFRLLLNCLFFAPLAFLVTDGALDQYWISAVVLTLGSPIIVISITSNPNHGKIIALGYIAMMFLVAAIAPKAVNWYLFAVYAGLAFMLGMFISQTIEVLMKSLKREQERTRELQESQRIIVEQQQALVTSSKMSALGEMAGGVAHEINNPLAAIKSLSSQIQEVLRDEQLDKKLLTEMASDVEKTTDRISKIVQGLRSFSRDGSKDPHQVVNVRQLIEETLSLCKERFKKSGIALTVDDFEQNLCFDGQSTQISQVILNLLNNAHDAISDLKDKWIKLSVSESSSWIEIRVTDCGAGIPKKNKDKIFQPFFTTKEIGKGTGMGLSISTGIIRSHHGELRLDQMSPNTCFVIRLPKKLSVKIAAYRAA